MADSWDGRAPPRAPGRYRAARAAGNGLPFGRLRFDVVAAPSQLFEVRRRLERWAQARGLGEELVEVMVFAVNEAVSNAVEHAYPDAAGHVWITAEHTVSDNLVLEISDTGQWRPQPVDTGFRGRGLMLLDHLADELELNSNDAGTRVRLSWRLPR